MYIVFDTETNGLPKDYNASPKNVDNYPRVIQLGYCIVDDNGIVVKEFESLIYPDGWEIPNDKFWIDNGYTTDHNKKKGLMMQSVLSQFIYDLEMCDFMVAHNMNFDYNVLCAEMIRYNIKSNKKLDKIYTMKSTIDFCAIPNKYGFKFPKLEELHLKLFGVKFENAHDALSDVRATVRCLFELKKLNVKLKS